MAAWWTIRYWRLTYARLQQREHVALRLWPFLPLAQRTVDDVEPLRVLNRMVRRLEAGDESFADDAAAQQLWQQARTDNDVQQAAGALRTLRLQLDQDSVAAGLQVAPFARAERKRLQKIMLADDVKDGLSEWLHAPVLLPMLSVLFLLSGWVYNAIFLGRFGVEVGRYFGLSDYLAASIDGLISAALAVLLTFAMQWLIRNRTRLQALQQQLGIGWINILYTLLIFVAATLFILLIPEAIDGGPEVRRLTLTYLIVLAVPLLLLQAVSGLSRRPSRDNLLASFLVIYGAVIWFSAETHVLKSQRPTALRAEIVFANAPDAPRQWRVLSGNSLYLFLLDDNSDVVVVPLQQVLSVRYRKPTGAGVNDAKIAVGAEPEQQNLPVGQEAANSKAGERDGGNSPVPESPEEKSKSAAATP
ncbi:MAG TPA: hypothetical protein VFV64_05395 [Permianibacter sp.]|nr:hypothetical protein [Permianibacter sp.]